MFASHRDQRTRRDIVNERHDDEANRPKNAGDSLAAFHQRSIELIDSATSHVTVLMVGRRGSVPQDIGSRMIVVGATGGNPSRDQSLHRLPNQSPLHWGTVGGGRVEAAAIKHALAILSGDAEGGLVRWNLNTDLGMTCGGVVEFFFDHVPAQSWPIHIFGAGHVSQALCRLLVSLRCQIVVHDSRRQWIERLPVGVDARCEEFQDGVVDSIADHAFVLCMTRGHSHDVPVLEAIAKSGRTFRYVGVIGSKSKSGAIRRELRQRGVDVDRFSFHCPIGLPIGTNHPAEIAISITAQLLQIRDNGENCNGEDGSSQNK